MNLFPPSSERDTDYKVYLSQFKAASKMIDTAATTRSFNEQMRQIIEKFTYFDHTTPKIMAIAMYMATTYTTFDHNAASLLIDTVYSNYNSKKDKSLLLIDVARYYYRLISPT